MIEPDAKPQRWLIKWIGWILMLSTTSLIGCTRHVVVGNFCDVYQVVDMPGEQSKRLDEIYKNRILKNELYEFENCP